MPNEPRSSPRSPAVEAVHNGGGPGNRPISTPESAGAIPVDIPQGDAFISRSFTIDGAAAERSNTRASSAAASALSEGQKGLWALQKMAPDMAAYNVPFCFRTLRPLDREAFRKACGALLERNPILANPIHEDAGGPYRAAEPSDAPFFHEEDASMLPDRDLLPYLRRKLKEPFVLERGPMIRVHILSRSPDEDIVLIVIHHISFDAGSFLPFATQLFDAYQEIVQQGAVAPAPQATSHVVFIEWERKLLEGGEARRHLDYWRQQLADAPPLLNLPTDLPRTGFVSFAGRTWEQDVPSDLADRVWSLCRAHGITPPTLFFSIYHVLLAKYAGEEDIVVGLTIDLRPQGDFEPFIGDFINMVPVRTRMKQTLKWIDFAKDLQIAVAGCLDHSAYPFTALVRALNVARLHETSPIFQAAFTYRKYFSGKTLTMMQERYADTLPFELVAGPHQEGEYDLRLEVSEEYDGLHFYLKFNPDLFKESTIDQMMRHYLNLVNEVIRDPTTPLNHLFLPTEAERNAISAWNSTEVRYPQEQCVHTLFEQQARRTPDAVAVVFGGQSLTYRGLDELSDALCASLQRAGVKPGDLVGVYVERSFDIVTGLLGILKSGGAYVPLDPSYPAERLEYLVKDSGVRCVLTQTALLDRLEHFAGRDLSTIVLDRDRFDATGRAQTQVTGEHLAYVLYTSGSTGNPKGVMITHRAFSNVLLAMLDKPGLRAQDRLFAITTYCFDIAGFELFGPLIKGACCVICPSEIARDADRLKDELRRTRATVMQATPAIWTMLFQSGWRNEERLKVLCGGEALPDRLRARFVEYGCEAWNLFGPTETTIWSTMQRIEKDGPRGIGQPIANTRIYIVDKDLRMTPIGIAGELCIAGAGLARGYHNKPKLTAERFVDNPFEPGEKLYRTGDIARWLPDGTIEHIGRADGQIKLRGYRIEVAEIELRLGAHPGIRNCAVILAASDDNKQLVAYYVREAGQSPFDARKLREYLRAKLPDYMVPALFVDVHEIPLTPNGKVDRKKLAQRDVPRTGAAAESLPESDIEKRVADIWKSVIGNDDIGINDGFFDVGGDSVLAITVAHRIRHELDCDFSVTALFKHSNVRAISKYIAQSRPAPLAEPPSPAPAVETRAPARATSANGKDAGAPLPAGDLRHPDYYRTSVAIIGISCHFPGAENYYEFWDNLLHGKEGVEKLTASEIQELGLTERAVHDPKYVPARSTIRGKDLFDPAFFKISPRDAELMDPQLRLLLLHAWKAVEDAGYVSSQMPDTGVFMSASSSFYGARAQDGLVKRDAVLLNYPTYQSWVLSQGGTIPTIISYKLGLRGPSFFVHSNCSSSLVGLHLACQSIMRGEATQALIGAATLLPHQSLGYLHEEGLHFSSDGSIRAFDASADGMIGGEGVAVILVKRASDALRDGDHIYALVRGVSINNDGPDRPGFYAPSVRGQADVICRAFDQTGVHPETINYVEAHGTGTLLGDPIEFAGLREAFGRYTGRQRFCGLGSVKSNIGHMDTAAGLAGVIKVSLGLGQGEIPRTINFHKLNPQIELEGSPFYVVESNQRLKRDEHPYRACVSSFGIGGTNAHAILEQTPDDRQPLEDATTVGLQTSVRHLIPLSARNEERLKEYAGILLEFITAGSVAHRRPSQQELNIAEVAYTLQIGREAMDARLALIAVSMTDLENKLRQFLAGDEGVEDLYRGHVRRDKEGLASFVADEDFQDTLAKWVKRGKYGKLLDLWVRGLSFDWRALYGAARPRRISLPTYPFAKERYWIAASESAADEAAGPRGSALHPLLHANTSDLAAQRFSSRFDGGEFFLRDHVIKDERVLPGVAYLEMARAAVLAAAGEEARGRAICLANVVWVRRFALGQAARAGAREVAIELAPSEDGAIAFEILSREIGRAHV